MADPDFTFFFEQFGGGGWRDYLAKFSVTHSVITRDLFNQHVANGFSEEQALSLCMSMQRDVVQVLPAMLRELTPVFERLPAIIAQWEEMGSDDAQS